MRISWQLSPLQIMIDRKQPENVEYFNYFGSITINNARCTREIKSGVGMAKAAFSKREMPFTKLNLTKKLLKC